MTYRSRTLLDLAHYIPCRATFEHECVGYRGCEPAHADGQIWGRGAGHKAPDCFFAAICRNAHQILTARVGSDLEREQKDADWHRAYVATQVWLWEHGWIKADTNKARREGTCV